MRPRRRAASLALILAGVAAGCRHAAPPAAPLPPGWRALAQRPAPFAALYRLSSGNQRNLVLTVRAGEGALSVSVAVPPGGAALSAWVAGDQGWVERRKEQCRDALPRGVIPFADDASLPLDANLAELLLSGLVPEGAREAPEAPGWVDAAVGPLLWRARIEGTPPVCTRVVVGGSGGAAPLEADLASPIGRVPGTITLRAGARTAELVLQEWHAAEAPRPPAWFALAPCGAAP